MQPGNSTTYLYLASQLQGLKAEVSKEIVKYNKLRNAELIESKLEKAYRDGFNSVLERKIGKGAITAISRALSIIVPLIKFGSGAYVAIASANLLPSAKKNKGNKGEEVPHEDDISELNSESPPRAKL